MKPKPLIEGKTKSNVKKTLHPKQAPPPPPPIRTIKESKHEATPVNDPNYLLENKTDPQIWEQMDADMEESGVAQGEIEGLKNHWKNKYIITCKKTSVPTMKNPPPLPPKKDNKTPENRKDPLEGLENAKMFQFKTDDDAKRMIEVFLNIIDQSDFHIPKFISGISLKSTEYKQLYNKENFELAKQNTALCCDEIIRSWQKFGTKLDKDIIEHYESLKTAIENYRI